MLFPSGSLPGWCLPDSSRCLLCASVTLELPSIRAFITLHFYCPNSEVVVNQHALVQSPGQQLTWSIYWAKWDPVSSSEGFLSPEKEKETSPTNYKVCRHIIISILEAEEIRILPHKNLHLGLEGWKAFQAKGEGIPNLGTDRKKGSEFWKCFLCSMDEETGALPMTEGTGGWGTEQTKQLIQVEWVSEATLRHLDFTP